MKLFMGQKCFWDSVVNSAVIPVVIVVIENIVFTAGGGYSKKPYLFH
jgi:hypothetical protein